MIDKKNNIRVRFAPSPTGHLHIGGLRSALFNWLFAKHNFGTFLLRIEDTDRDRSTKEFTDSILDTFNWLVITPDEPVTIQSARINDHRNIIQKLLEEKKAYRCYCTIQELENRLDKKAGNEVFIPYDRYCLNNETACKQNNKPYVIRFKLPNIAENIAFEDIIRGPVSFALEQFDDFIIVRSDGTPVYNFVVVVDDAYMNITHVIRGEEHLTNTPKQLLLYHACNYIIPQFAHLPVILGPDGSKLSKRDGATSVMEYKKMGYLPEALINYLVRLGWSHNDQELFTRQELIDYFTLSHVGKKGAIFDIDKLNWINNHYIKSSSNDVLMKQIIENIEPDLKNILPNWNENTIQKTVGLYKDRVKTLIELVEEIKNLYNGPIRFDSYYQTKEIDQTTIDHLQTLVNVIEKECNNDNFSITGTVKKFAKDHTIQLVTIAQPLRAALLGKSAGPGIFSLLELISTEQILYRLKNCLKK